MKTRKYTLTLLSIFAAISILTAEFTFAWGGPKGSQFLDLEKLKDAKVLEETVDNMTDDTKGKHFGKISKVVIPSYYIEYRTVSSGKALKKGSVDVSVNAHVTYANPDKAIMEAIAAEGLADLKTRFAAAGYEVVEPGDFAANDRYKKLTFMESGTVAESTAQPIGWSKFMAMFVSAGGAPMYPYIPGEPNWGPTVSMDSAAFEGTLWKAAGGDDVGIVRSRMILDFVTFVGDTGVTYDGLDNSGADKFKNYAKISAIPQIQVWLASLCATRTYIFWGDKILADNLGCVNVKGEIQLASKIIGDDLGTLSANGDENNGEWTFTANNEKYKEAAIEQIKINNVLLVEKAKSFK